MTVKRAVFLGSKAFGLVILRTLVESEPRVSWTVLHPHDENDERTKVEAFETFCGERSLDFRLVTPSEANEAMSWSGADVVFVCGWYNLIPSAVLEAGPVFLGIHNSLLPRYRGGAPLVWAIIAGDTTVGSSLFVLGEGMDDGDIYLQVSVPLGADEGIAEALAAIEREYVARLPAFWRAFVSGQAQRAAQDSSRATYCAQRVPADGLIDWSRSANAVCDFVRAQSRPYPGAFTVIDGEDVRIWRCEMDTRPWLARPGQVVERREDHVVVACGGNTAVVIREAQSRTSDDAARIFHSIALRLHGQGAG